MTYFLITMNIPSADSLAEELGQRLLAKKVVNEGLSLIVYNSHATLEFQSIPGDAVEKIKAEVADWIFQKHSRLSTRTMTGKRQRQNLGMPTEAAEEAVCLEIRK